MILANLTKAIREQKWFAVVLEFLIVIAGVVIGFQITAWNQDRDNREKELSLLSRLHDEVLSLIEVREPDSRTILNRFEKALDVQAILIGTSQRRPLTDAECYALVLAHDFYYPQVTLPSLNESMTAGQFDLLTNVTLRTELARYVQISEQALAIHQMIIEDSERLTADHHAYFTNEPRTVSEAEALELAEINRYDSITLTDRVMQVCNFEAMLNDPKFINDNADLIGKAYTYQASVIVPPDRQLERLRDMLASELSDRGITP